MMITRALLFDLDGTLNDSKPGIYNGMKTVLRDLGYPEPADAVLSTCIGPPLEDNFMRLLQTQDPALIRDATERYHDFYERIGIEQNQLYPGIAELIPALRQAGYTLFLATSKLQAHAEKNLEAFGLRSYFQGVQGASRDGQLRHKVDIIHAVLQQHPIMPAEAIMIGDHAVDVLGGRQHGLRTVAVTYGYGTLAELSAAHPDRMCDDTHALSQAIIDLMGG